MSERTLRVYRSNSNPNNPMIILQGKWLANLNFAAGDYLTLSCQNNLIKIQIKEKFQKEQEQPREKHR